MKAGEAMDALVAEKVMGWNAKQIWMVQPSGNLPRYSTDIAAAWEVVERLRSDGWHFDLAARGTWPSFPEYTWECSMALANELPLRELAATAPEAICLAALKAVGVEVGE